MPIWSPWQWENPHHSAVEKTTAWNLPVRKDRTGREKLAGTKAPVLVCPGSDFFAAGAEDLWEEALSMMRLRRDLFFLLFTEKADRAVSFLPPDLRREEENIGISIRIRRREEADRLLPLLEHLPFSHREIRVMPLSAPLDLREILETGTIAGVFVSGEEAAPGTVLDFSWAEEIRRQCEAAGTAFSFVSTGPRILVGGKAYAIPERFRQSQAAKAGLDWMPEKEEENVRIRLEKERALSSGDPALDRLFVRLSLSGFRSGFSLSGEDREYIREKGMETIRRHAQDFVAGRLAPAHPAGDGRQTPMRGHPVFVAQHATGCCCRGCLYKWHGIPEGRPLSDSEQRAVTDILLEWIRRQLL